MIPNNKNNRKIKEPNNDLMINNDKYTKNFVDIDINLKNNKQFGSVKTKYKTPGKTAKPVIPPFNNKQNSNLKNENNQNTKNKVNNIPKSTNLNKGNKTKNNINKKQNDFNLMIDDKKDNNNDETLFNTNISMISSSTNKNNNPKDKIKIMVNKIENIYKEALNNSQKFKSETLPFNINYNQKDMIQILLEEIKYLKIKSELIKLKSNLQETIFYSIKELIEEEKINTSFNPDLSNYISNFHNKILCILTQNNQKFYENLKLLDDNNNSETLFAFNLREDDIMDKINQKNIKVITNIEENIQKIVLYN